MSGKGGIETMKQATNCSVTDRGLRQQGYVGLSAEELSKLKWGLRFTPTVCMAGCVVGLATQNVWLHYGLAVLGTMAVVLPAHHPLDMVYNYGVRLFTGGPKLPPNPLPRATACFLGGMMNLGIALSFQAGLMALAYTIGVALVVLQLIVISSHVCVASWMLEMIGKVFGRSGPSRIDPEHARQLVTDGAVLLDVRSPQEFGATHLPQAVNIPVDQLASRLDEIRHFARPVIVYCASGMRSGKATGILRDAEIENVHDLGPLSRW
jgi:rhodanese-related sulfurtransferase